MPSIHFLALWTVLDRMQTEDLEAFSRWLLSAPDGDITAEEGLLQNVMIAARKLPPDERSSLSDFVVGAIESRYADK